MAIALHPPTAQPAAVDGQAVIANDKRAQARKAGQQLEGVFLQQVLKVLWQATPGMNGPQADMYKPLFESAFADHLAGSGKFGIAGILEKAMCKELNVDSEAPVQLDRTLHRTGMTSIERAAWEVPAIGKAADLQSAAMQMLEGGGRQWSKDGALSNHDLPSDLGSAVPGGESRQRVREAGAYQGYYKCNLFAFELARRAGFEVPIVARGERFGFPGTAGVTRDAQDGRMSGGWGKVVTGESPESLDTGLRDGSRAFLLTGAGHGDAHGHMAIVERVHSIDYAADGTVRRMVFDGWEARPEGASHLVNRTWNMFGNPGGTELARNGLKNIEIIELVKSGAVVQPAPNSTDASRGTDATGLSPSAEHPNSGSKELP